MMFKSTLLVAMVAVASAEHGIWDKAMDLVESAIQHTQQRTKRDDSMDGNSTMGNSSNLFIPLAAYAEYPEYFAVDFCSRYHCKCFRLFSTDEYVKKYNNQSWSFQDKSSDKAGCIKGTEKDAYICMWDKRVCNCDDEAFFEENEEGYSGVDFLYPRHRIVDMSNATDSELQRLAYQNSLRSKRSSSTENVCIQCEYGYTLSGGHCYLDSGASPALVMAIVIGLVSVSSLSGIWYVLHSIEDNGFVDNLPDYDEKKNY